MVALTRTGIILTPIIVLNAAGSSAGLEWAVFSALVVSGLATILQARPAGPIGGGYSLYMGTSGAFIGVSAAAVVAGGLLLLASLVAVSSLVQSLFSARLSFFRRLIAPTVGGTVIMLLAVNVFPITTDLLTSVPAGVDPLSPGVPLVAVATFVITPWCPSMLAARPACGRRSSALPAPFPTRPIPAVFPSPT